MNPRYKQFVLSRFKNLATDTESIMHAAVGIAGEGGECLDAAKKHWIYNIDLDKPLKDGQTIRQNLVEELGDSFFYATALMSLLNVTLEEVLDANETKLLKRYPEGYTDRHAEARLDKA